MMDAEAVKTNDEIDFGSTAKGLDETQDMRGQAALQAGGTVSSQSRDKPGFDLSRFRITGKQ